MLLGYRGLVWVFLIGASLALGAATFAACSGETMPPSTSGQGGGGSPNIDGDDGGAAGSSDAGQGGCINDADCEDNISCTIDHCIQGLCYHQIDNPNGCAPNQFCDPAQKGCVAAPACKDDLDCKFVFIDHPCIAIKYCKAATKTCSFKLLDGDGDGHVPLSCGGDDCDDNQIMVHPEAAEVCDGFDNDCSGTIDVDPSIDFTSPKTCGTCGNNCYLKLLGNDLSTIACEPSPMPQVVPGKCTGSCAEDYYDLDQDPDGTCEYFCKKSADSDSICDNKDNDCDGFIDEDLDLCASPINCGSCNTTCFVLHGVPKCVNDGTMPCTNANTHCEIQQCECNGPGDCWKDLDGDINTGCEYNCSESNGGVEMCADGLDNDCDGQIDEGC